MKVNISKRLKTVAESVSECEVVADIGCDHGFLPIYLLLTKQGIYRNGTNCSESRKLWI